MPPQTMPFSAATAISLPSSRRALPAFTWPSAIERMISVIVWLPELPAMPATIGISVASATTRSIVPSKASMTREAMNAVHRFSASHSQRLRADAQTLEKMSSSSRRPALASISDSASSRMRSSTSATVTRPITRLLGSTTGAETRS